MDVQDHIEELSNQVPELAVATEPKLHSLAWYDAVIASNEMIVAQKLADYHQAAGGLAVLKQLRELAAKE